MGFEKKDASERRDELVRKGLRDYLQAPSFYTDKEGKKHWKRWQPKSDFEKMRDTYYRNCNLPLRFNLGFWMSFLPSLVLLVCLMFVGGFILSLTIAGVSFVVACVSLPFLIKRWDGSPILSAQQDKNASDMIGLGAISGFFLGIFIITAYVTFSGYAG